MSDLEEFPENDPIFFYHQRLVHASQILWVLLWVSKSSFFDKDIRSLEHINKLQKFELCG